MKAERRHELKENDLAHFIAVAQDYLGQHGRQIGLAVGAVVVVFIAVTLAMRSQANAADTAWRQRAALKFDDVATGRESLTTLATLAQQSSDPAFAFSGLLDVGANALRLAQQVEVPPDKELNLQAKSAYEKLLERFSHNPIAVGAARCGLATVAENAFAIDGDLSHKEEARKHLDAVVQSKSLESTPYQLAATDRLAALDETFVRVRWAEPKPGEESAAAPDAAPADVTAQPVGENEIPPEVLRQFQEQLMRRQQESGGTGQPAPAPPPTSAVPPSEPKPSDDQAKPQNPS